MTQLPVPTREHPAKWLTVTDLVLGDVVVTHRRGKLTGRVTALVPQRGKRTRVVVDGVTYYPHALGDGPVLVLR